MEKLEKMADFFAKRVEMYDGHMLEEVEGCKEGYIRMSEFVPENCKKLLDLGCGTGLELDAIFRKIPDLSVTGIDLCEAMLSKLKEKFYGKNIRLICGDYFTEDFGDSFDCAVSFQTMHHFSHEKKASLYNKIFDTLTDKGIYIECDYMVETEEEEEHWFSENERLRQLQNIGADEFFHYDTPCTIENQIKLLKAAGFSSVEKVMRIENTTMLVARKVKKMFDVVLFDLDGTLTDPGEGITNSVAYALRKYGIEVTDKKKLYSFIGPPLSDSFMKYYGFTEEKAMEAIWCYREYFRDKGIFENEVYDGIPELLGKIKESGRKIVLATSKPEEFALRILEHFDLLKYFDVVAGASMDEKRNKKGDIIKYALEKGGFNKENAVMTGDREHDIFGAKENNLASIGVLYGYGSRDELEKAGADYITASVEGIFELL